MKEGYTYTGIGGLGSVEYAATNWFFFFSRLISNYGRELSLGDFMENISNIVLRSDTDKLFAFNLGLMLKTTSLNFYSLKPVLMILSQGHKKARPGAVILV